MKSFLLTSCLLLGACASTNTNSGMGSTLVMTVVDFQQWSLQYPDADVKEYAPRAQELLLPGLDLTLTEWTADVVPSQASNIIATTIVTRNPKLAEHFDLIAAIVETLNNV